MALVKNTNCGFVTAAPVADPNEGTQRIDYQALAMKCEAPPYAVKVTEIGWYCSNATEAADFEVGVYEQNAGDNNPEALVGKSAATAKGTTEGWKKVTGLNIAIVAGQTYWLAAELDDTATMTNADGKSDAGQKTDMKTLQTELEDPWGASSGTYGILLGIYAVYETSVPANIKSNGSLYGELPSAA